MNREQLLDFATRYVAWLNKNPSDEATLSKLMSRDISIPIEYPGATPTYDGSVKFMEDLHAGTHDINFKIIDTCVDELHSSVTVITRAVGTHSGEWLGVPATGNKFDVKSFMMMKLDPKTGLMRELSLINQDALLLTQFGVLPPPPTRGT